MLLPKDIIQSIGGQTTKYADEVIAYLDANKNKKVEAIVLRNEKQVPVQVQINSDGKLGIVVASVGIKSLEKLGIYKFSQQEYGLFESVSVGIEKGTNQLVGYGKQFLIYRRCLFALVLALVFHFLKQ